MDFLLSPSLPAAMAVVAVAYVIFGMAGFGTALIAAPLLVRLFPLPFVIALLALLDFIAALFTSLRFQGDIARTEIKRLLPWMLAGNLVGASALFGLESRWLILLLGLFLLLYCAWQTFLAPTKRSLGPRWAVPLGSVGGVFSALFGSGGFVYALYLSGRLETKEQISATQAALIGLSTLIRLTTFTLAGAYFDIRMLTAALVLLPVMAAGLWVGRRIHMRLTRQQFMQAMTLLLAASGISLLVKAW